MMIKWLRKESGLCPAIFCDVCGKVIENVDDGVAMGDKDADKIAMGEGSALYHVHRAHCHLEIRERLGYDETAPLNLLVSHLFLLIHNMEANEGIYKILKIEHDIAKRNSSEDRRGSPSGG